MAAQRGEFLFRKIPMGSLKQAVLCPHHTRQVLAFSAIEMTRAQDCGFMDTGTLEGSHACFPVLLRRIPCLLFCSSCHPESLNTSEQQTQFSAHCVPDCVARSEVQSAATCWKTWVCPSKCELESHTCEKGPRRKASVVLTLAGGSIQHSLIESTQSCIISPICNRQRASI